MRQNARVTFAIRDLDRLKCVQAVVDGDLKLVRASERLGLTTRQVRRLARRYAAVGPVGLLSKRFNRPSNNRLDETLADPAIKILRSTYADFGPATERLRTKPGIDLAKERRPASARVAPVCDMHYDAACPQWNGSIAVASRCTSKTIRLRTFTSSRQVTNVYLWLSNRSKYWRARPIHAM